jgi:hypothetical protein
VDNYPNLPLLVATTSSPKGPFFKLRRFYGFSEAMKISKQASLVTVIALASALGLSACGASTALQNTCTRVGAVLANGPNRSADPLGYAEAQVGPLLQIKTSDKSLHAALQYLSSAYLENYNTDGSSAARELLSKANKRVDNICPGATS